MKTAQEYYEEAMENWEEANKDDPSDCYQLESYMVSAMKRYAAEVTQNHLDELDDLLCGEYNLATDPDIKTP